MIATEIRTQGSRGSARPPIAHAEDRRRTFVSR